MTFDFTSCFFFVGCCFGSSDDCVGEVVDTYVCIYTKASSFLQFGRRGEREIYV